MTVPSAGDIIRLLLFEPDNVGVVLEGFLKKYMHQSVKVNPTYIKVPEPTYNDSQNKKKSYKWEYLQDVLELK